MIIKEKPNISGEPWFYILDDKESGGCGEMFLLAPKEFQANGRIKCEFCPNICRKEDIKEDLTNVAGDVRSIVGESKSEET